MIKILILIDYSSEFSRKFLQGLIQYSKEFGPWIFYRLPVYYKILYGKQGIINWAKEWKADALIAQWDQEETDMLNELDIPIILQNFKSRSESFSNLTGDYIGTGKIAAQFFARKKYKNFAFYGNKNALWSCERAKGFFNEVQKTGGNYFYFETEVLNEESWNSSHIELDNWLLSLPKPVGLFACDDSFALQVSDICKINNINIPNEISLLGVDNDELICNLSDPPISSIVLDIERGGYEAGKLIHQLIKKEKNEPFNITVKAIRIELRLSTEKYNISNKYIAKVIDHIEKNFDSNLHIDELTELVPLSRRNLETKFKNELGISIYQFILNCRIELYAYLLLTTDKSLLDIAIECGFNDCKNISRIFRKFKHYTPLEYKQRFKNPV